MKITISTILAAFVASAVVGAQEGRFQQEAILIDGPDEWQQVWIMDANKTTMRYYETVKGVDAKDRRISSPAGIWFMEPKPYTEAMELYQGRQYEEAAKKFGEIREYYERLREIPGNHSSLSAFYQLECYRKLGKLDELKVAIDKFLPIDRESLARPHHLEQLKLYDMWDAVRVKDWSRLERIAEDRLKEKMPGYQRAQVGYCYGMALEGLKKPIKAINAYNIGMTADTGASEFIARQSALNALRLYWADESLQFAIRMYDTPDRDDQSSASFRLREAASLAALYKLTIGGGEPLPDDFEKLLKYLPKEQ